MSQEIIELLKKALKKGKDNLPNTWEIHQALAKFKAEQPPEGDFCDFMEEVKDEIKKAPKMFHQLQKRDELIKELRTNLDKKDKLLFAYESVRAPKKPLASDFTKDLRDEVETLQLYASDDETRGAFKFADHSHVCTHLECDDASRN